MKRIFFVLTNNLRCFDETDVRTSQKTTYAQFKICRTNFIDEIGPRYGKWWATVDVLPLIDYGSSSWGSTTKQNIERIYKLQKRAARIILKVDFITLSVEMFQRLRWMTVSQRINYNKAVLTYKALNNLTPAYISDLLTLTAIAYNRNLRSSENGSLMVPKSRTSFYTGSFTVSAPKLWNTFPTSVKQATSLNTFKRAMTEFI